MQSEAHVRPQPLCFQTPLMKSINLPELWHSPALLVHLPQKHHRPYSNDEQHCQNSFIKPWLNVIRTAGSTAFLSSLVSDISTDTFSSSSSTAFLSRRDLSICDSLSAHSYIEVERKDTKGSEKGSVRDTISRCRGKKSFLRNVSFGKGKFLPAAVQTTPLPYVGFEYCTVCAHFPPVKDKSQISDLESVSAMLCLTSNWPFLDKKRIQ